MSQRPGWARPCTCGTLPTGYYCRECTGFSAGFDGEAEAHLTPRPVEPRAKAQTEEPKAAPTEERKGFTLGH